MPEVFAHANLFNADVELRRILLAAIRKPVPFLTLHNFGLTPQTDRNPFQVPYESECPPSTSEQSNEPPR